MDSTSASLLRRIREPAADAAWQRMVDLYAPLIYHWGHGQGLSSTDAADLVQEVFAALIAKLPEFEYDPRQRFRGWLRTVTVNRARDMHRRNTVRPAASGGESVAQLVDSRQGDLFDEVEHRQFLARRALELMRAEFQPAVWQACWEQVVEGRKPAEIAAELGMTVNMVYLAKSRVVARLREELEGLLD